MMLYGINVVIPAQWRHRVLHRRRREYWREGSIGVAVPVE